MDEIRKWLKGPRDYESGAKLYIQHGTDRNLRKIFMEPASDFKKKKLVEVLSSMVTKKQHVAEKVAVTKEVALRHISKSPGQWPAELDPTLKALKEKWKPLFAEMMNLSARIYDVALEGTKDPAKKAEAGEMAHRILDLDDECDAIYQQRDHYIQFGKLKAEKKPMDLVVDPVKIPVALENARRYVRQYRNKLKKNPGDVQAAEKMKQYEWAVSEYERILKLDV